jgi:hypothetical protein
MKNTYTIGDKIKHIRNSVVETPADLINTGTVTYGPVKVEGMLHYRVKWDKVHEGRFYQEETIETLLSSKKYSFKLI